MNYDDITMIETLKIESERQNCNFNKNNLMCDFEAATGSEQKRANFIFMPSAYTLRG